MDYLLRIWCAQGKTHLELPISEPAMPAVSSIGVEHACSARS